MQAKKLPNTTVSQSSTVSRKLPIASKRFHLKFVRESTMCHTIVKRTFFCLDKTAHNMTPALHTRIFRELFSWPYLCWATRLIRHQHLGIEDSWGGVAYNLGQNFHAEQLIFAELFLGNSISNIIAAKIITKNLFIKIVFRGNSFCNSYKTLCIPLEKTRKRPQTYYKHHCFRG